MEEKMSQTTGSGKANRQNLPDGQVPSSRSNSLSIEGSLNSLSLAPLSNQTAAAGEQVTGGSNYHQAASSGSETSNSQIDVASCLDDIEQLARDKLERGVFEYYLRGADDEITKNWNRTMITQRYCLRSRLMRNVSEIDTSLYLFGDRLSIPIGFAPTAMHRLAHPDGELATVRACQASNALMILSLFSNTRLEKVAIEEPTCTKWFNLYIMKDRALTYSLAHAAIKYNYRALVVTCDAPTLGKRRNDGNITFNIDSSQLMHFDQTAGSALIANQTSEQSSQIAMGSHAKALLDPSVTWQDLADLKKTFAGLVRVVAKGIMCAQDAEEALNAGVDAIYISNHGGRQLDGQLSTIEVLPEIVRAVGKRCPIFIDGGFRTGSDVLKALALGATMVFVGRPNVWGLAVEGERGVKKILEKLEEELRRAMMFCGCRNLNEINSSLIVDRKTNF